MRIPDTEDRQRLSHLDRSPAVQSRWAAPLGIVMIILGVVAIALPLFVTLASTVIFGWVFIAAGIAQVIYAFQGKGAGHVIWKVILGLLYCLGGIFVLTHLIEGVFTLTLVVGITIFLQGIIQVVMSFQTRRVSPRWIWMLISGLIGIVLGIYIWSQLSSTAPWLIGTLVGINLLFDGIWMLTLHSGGRRTLTEQ